MSRSGAANSDDFHILFPPTLEAQLDVSCFKPVTDETGSSFAAFSLKPLAMFPDQKTTQQNE